MSSLETVLTPGGSWPALLTESAALLSSVLPFTFQQDLHMAALNFEKTVFL